MPNQNPLPFQVRGGGGQIRVRCAVPTSFLRGCGEPTTRAGDLTCSSNQLSVFSNQFVELTVARQCRTSQFRVTGFAFEPSHPGARHPGRLSCAFDCMTRRLRCQLTNVTKKPLSRAALESHRYHPEPPTCAHSRGSAGGRPVRRADARRIWGIGTSAGCHLACGAGWNPALPML